MTDCDDQEGAADVNRPYLAIGGTLDTTAPVNMTRRALNRMGSSRYLVELDRRGPRPGQFWEPLP